jgi:hypothetical protein
MADGNHIHQMRISGYEKEKAAVFGQPFRSAIETAYFI